MRYDEVSYCKPSLIASRIIKYIENRILFNFTSLTSLSLTIVFLFAYNSHDKEILNT